MEQKKIRPARRVENIKEYYFSRKLKEVAQLNAEGKDIISLGVGGPDLPPCENAIERLDAVARRPDSHGYQPVSGLPDLRKAYSEWYARWYGVVLDPATEIQPLIGSKEGILIVNLAFLNPGDGVLVPNPGYLTYTSGSELVEAEIFRYDLKEENGWYPDFKELEKMPLDKIKLMWVNYPNMPTGVSATKMLYERLVDFGQRHNIVIVNDNPYSFILHDKPMSILSVDGAKDIAIELNSMSKSHNMAGWRMAMLASNGDFVNWVLKVQSNIESGQFRPMMEAAIEALSCGKEWYDKMNNVYSSRRKLAEQVMEALHCTFDSRQRGLFLWGRIPVSAGSSEEFADRVLYDARVFITPGTVFGSNGEGYVRISLCADEDKFREALKRINDLNI